MIRVGAASGSFQEMLSEVWVFMMGPMGLLLPEKTPPSRTEREKGGAPALSFIILYKPQIRFAPTTKPRVRPAIKTSPRAPTMNGRKPCLDISRKFVRRPTPAKVSRNAHFDRFPNDATCALLKV